MAKDRKKEMWRWRRAADWALWPRRLISRGGGEVICAHMGKKSIPTLTPPPGGLVGKRKSYTLSGSQ